jgi:hypothetical protein
MKPKITNNCKNTYKPDQIKMTNKILEKIPDKFLLGLNEIVFHDRSNDPVIKYVLEKKGEGSTKIDIYMGGFATKGKYSLLHYNLLLLPTIADHIVKYLKPISDDPDIQAVVRHRYNPKWVYLGPLSSVFMAPLNLVRFLFNKVSFFHSLINRVIKNFMGKHSNT